MAESGENPGMKMIELKTEEKQPSVFQKIAWVVGMFFTGVLLFLVMFLLAAEPQIWKPYILDPFQAALDVNLAPSFEAKSTSTTSISGKTNIPSQVELLIDGTSVAQQKTTPEGKFTFKDILLSSGENKIEVRAVAFIGWRKLKNSSYAEIPVKKERPSVPTLFDLPVVVSSDTVLLKGKADADTKVWINVSGLKKFNKRLLAKPTGLHGEGAFKAELKLPQPDEYTITAQAEDKQGVLSFPSRSSSTTYDPSHTVVRQPETARKLAISVWNDRVEWNLEVTLPSKDPRAVALVTGQKKLWEFVHEVIPLQIGEQDLASVLREVSPSFSISEPNKLTDSSITTIRANKVGAQSLPWFGEEIKVSIPAWASQGKQFLQQPEDSLSIALYGYPIQFYKPQPSVLENGVATWIGGQNDESLSKEIIIQPSKLSLKEAGGLARLVRSTPQNWIELLPSQSQQFFQPIVAFLYSLLWMIPMLWVLALVRKDKPPILRYNYSFLLFLMRAPTAWLLYLREFPQLYEQRKSFNRTLESVTHQMIGFTSIPVLLSLNSTIKYSIFQLVWVLQDKRSNPQTFVSSWSQTLQSSYGIQLKDLIHDLSNLWGSLSSAISPFICLIIIGLAAKFAKLLTPKKYQQWLTPIFQGLGFAAFFTIRLIPIDYIPYEANPILIQILVTLIGFYLIKRLYAWVSTLFEHYPDGHRFRLGNYHIIAVLLALALACPFDISAIQNYYSQFRETSIQSAYSYLWSFLYRIRDLIPYVLLLGIVLLLKQSKSANRRAIIVGLIVFSCYLVSTTSNWMFIPIPFLLAIWLFFRIVIVTHDKRWKLDLAQFTVQKDRRSLLRRVLSKLEPSNFRKALDNLEKKVISGDLSISEFEQREKEIAAYTSLYKREEQLLNYFSASDVVLGFGPKRTHWENGCWAAKHSWILILIFSMLFIPGLFESGSDQSSYWFIIVASQITIFILDWLIAAFFFGYFFPYIRGDSGLKKGLIVSLTIVLCFAPIWLLFLTDPMWLIVRIGQYVFFFTTLGTWAFDYHTFRQALGEQGSWRKFFQVTDLPNFTTSASIILTSLGVALNSVITGQFTSIVSSIISATIPEAPKIPPSGGP